jgi:hypothetical protein
MEAEVVGEEAIAARIHGIRGQKVMLAHDLAALYGVPTYRLNEAVKRNMTRFPEDFMFQLTSEEWSALTSRSAISRSWGGRRRQVCVAEDLSKQDGPYGNAHVVAGLKARSTGNLGHSDRLSANGRSVEGLKARPHTHPIQRPGLRGHRGISEGLKARSIVALCPSDGFPTNGRSVEGLKARPHAQPMQRPGLRGHRGISEGLKARPQTHPLQCHGFWEQRERFEGLKARPHTRPWQRHGFRGQLCLLEG